MNLRGFIARKRGLTGYMYKNLHATENSQQKDWKFSYRYNS